MTSRSKPTLDDVLDHLDELAMQWRADAEQDVAWQANGAVMRLLGIVADLLTTYDRYCGRLDPAGSGR